MGGRLYFTNWTGEKAGFQYGVNNNNDNDKKTELINAVCRVTLGCD